MDERVLGVAELADAEAWSVNEVFGFVARLFLQAAQQGSDYRVSMGTAMALSPRYELLLALAARSGLLKVDVEDDRKVIRLVQDGEFLHLRTKEEMSWERARKDDTSNLAYVVPIRARDGDACRYCGEVVNWGDRKGKRGGTYDHLTPGESASSFHDMVVACRGCNGGRRDAEGKRGRRFQLMPAPAEGQVYYAQRTIQWLTENAELLTAVGMTPPKPRRGKDRAPGTSTRPSETTTVASGAPVHAEHAAPSVGGEQRSAASLTRPEHAAPHASGEQRSGTARDQDHPSDPEHAVPARAAEGSADAASHTSGEQRAEHPPVVPDADQKRGVSTRTVHKKPAPACDDTGSRSDLDPEAAGSGSSGSGRDGTGRARVGPVRDGPGRAGQGREARPLVPGAGKKRKKRGRRRRG